MSFDPIDMDKYDLYPNLMECREVTIFADLIAPIVKRVENLNYGIMSMLIYGMQDILRDMEYDIPKKDHEMIMKIYYMMIGVFLTKKDIDLIITKEQLIELGDIVDELLQILYIIESFYKKELDVIYENDEWIIKLGEHLRQTIGEKSKEYTDELV